VGSWKVESPDELQEDLIKGGRGTSFKWSHQEKLGVKDLGWKLAKVSLGHERGFKILPDNDAKMLSHKL
jgi:hypothetical protein